jgi:CubicO group peptidase (beta-lactamase class C family)
MKLRMYILPGLLVAILVLWQLQPPGVELDVFLKEKIDPDGPGVAVLVWKEGKVYYKKGFGIERKDRVAPISSSTTFRMASVSKQFTAMSILILEKNQKISFSDKISRFFPELDPALSEKITVRHLLTHTSGIPDYEDLMDSTSKRQITDADIVRLLSSERKTYFQPGTKFRYSNTAFCLLAMITERVSRKPYRVFMKENIFEKLGMKRTFLYDASALNNSRALGYARNKEGEIVDSDQSATSATLGDGCVYTCLDDYLIWFKALKNNTLLDLGKNLRQVGYAFPNHPGKGYGLGWFYNELKDGTFELTHSGSTCGFSNLVILSPEKDRLVVCFSNLANNHALLGDIVKIIGKDKQFEFQTDWSEMHKLTN